ncbi:MAG: hypothetical protein ACE364_08395 [Chlorobiota bacterium]
MLKKFLKISIIITLFILGFSTSISQIRISTRGYMSYSSRTQIDSIFVNYESPNLPDTLSTITWSEINFVCDIATDTAGKVRSIYIYPLNFNNVHIEADSHLWKEVSDSIVSISKYWKFKSLEWITEGLEPKLNKETFEKYNRMTGFGPFNDQPRYLIILSLCNECIYNDHDFYHHINDNENRLTR